MKLVLTIVQGDPAVCVDYITTNFDCYYPIEDAFDNDEVNSPEKIKERFIKAVKPLYGSADVKITGLWVD